MNQIKTMKNKYNLTISKIRELKVADRTLIKQPVFWRNDVIHAWCITNYAGTAEDCLYCTENSFWIGIYDDDAPCHAGEFQFSLEAYGGMCSYNFEYFFDPKYIENDNDLLIQKKFLAQITKLLDMGVLIEDK